mmetsp:Transcript_46187/g.122570  ORF Transcript_46187/g.122570 Transcript_46187/m.122570 type:complete len:216 (-) Transcript_46187:338-985(-)
MPLPLRSGPMALRQQRLHAGSPGACGPTLRAAAHSARPTWGSQTRGSHDAAVCPAQRRPDPDPVPAHPGAGAEERGLEVAVAHAAARVQVRREVRADPAQGGVCARLRLEGLGLHEAALAPDRVDASVGGRECHLRAAVAHGGHLAKPGGRDEVLAGRGKLHPGWLRDLAVASAEEVHEVNGESLATVRDQVVFLGAPAVLVPPLDEYLDLLIRF